MSAHRCRSDHCPLCELMAEQRKEAADEPVTNWEADRRADQHEHWMQREQL